MVESALELLNYLIEFRSSNYSIIALSVEDMVSFIYTVKRTKDSGEGNAGEEMID